VLRASLFCLMVVLASSAAWSGGNGVGWQSVVNNTVPAGTILFGGPGSTCNGGSNGCLLNDINGKLLAR
jgi:hypothetical protein